MKTTFKFGLLSVLVGLSAQSFAAGVSISCSLEDNAVEFNYTLNEGESCSVEQALTVGNEEIIDTFDVVESQTTIASVGDADSVMAEATLTCSSGFMSSTSSASTSCSDGDVANPIDPPEQPGAPEVPGFPEVPEFPAIPELPEGSETSTCTVINGVQEGDCEGFEFPEIPGFPEVPEFPAGGETSTCTVINGVQEGECGEGVNVSTCRIINGVEEGECEELDICSIAPRLAQCN